MNLFKFTFSIQYSFCRSFDLEELGVSKGLSNLLFDLVISQFDIVIIIVADTAKFSCGRDVTPIKK